MLEIATKTTPTLPVILADPTRALRLQTAETRLTLGRKTAVGTGAVVLAQPAAPGLASTAIVASVLRGLQKRSATFFALPTWPPTASQQWVATKRTAATSATSAISSAGRANLTTTPLAGARGLSAAIVASVTLTRIPKRLATAWRLPLAPARYAHTSICMNAHAERLSVLLQPVASTIHLMPPGTAKMSS